MKPLLTNDSPIINGHLTMSNMRTKRNFQIKCINSEIAWKIIRRCPVVYLAILRWNLCLNEKLEIATYQGKSLLNKRLEIVPKSRNFNKFLLINFEAPDSKLWMSAFIAPEFP